MNGTEVSRRKLLLQMGAATGFVTLWLTGCSDDKKGNGGTDSGQQNGNDSGQQGQDSGQQQQDASQNGNDSGTQQDASVQQDAGHDAGDLHLACVNQPSISGNHVGHLHSITVPLNHLMNIQQRTYDITGSSLHSHSVTLSVQNFNDLIAGGTTVSVTSTSGAAHTHTLSWTC